MRFTFKCHVAKHVSGRVTVTPIELPELAVHAATLPRALEELTLALDDRITRAHPRRLFEFTRPCTGEPVELRVPILRVWGAEDDAGASLRVFSLLAPAHRPYVEVRAPRLDLRLWLAAKDVLPRAAELIRDQLEELDDDALLTLRPEETEAWLDLELDAAPLRLSDLRRSELHLDEKPPPTAADGDEEPARDEDEDDDWGDDLRRRRARPKIAHRPTTPTLSRLGTPWHTLASDGALDQAYERDDLVDRLRARLRVADPEPLVLVGPSGVGKTALLQELARRLAAEEDAIGGDGRGRPRALRPFFFLDGARLIAGQGFFGDWQRQVLDSLREARAAGAILNLGRVVDLLEAGKSAHSDQNVAQLIAPALSAREIAVLAEATPEEWARVEQRNQGFARAFAVLQVDDPPPEVVARILAAVAADLSSETDLAVEPSVVAEAQALCRRFMPYGAPVGNAVAFLRRLARARAQCMATSVNAGDALAFFSSESGIPARLLDDSVPLDETEVRAFLSARVMGQEAAVARTAQVISVIKANLSDRRRPSAVLLFAGPTGVGKTELSKALAELVFGSRERLVRLDMGEFAGPDAIARLIGDGALPGHLTRVVRRQPFSVVLLDEIEKAHPAVLDALLGVLGEGRLSDASGKLTDFRSTVLILTSNLGAEARHDPTGFAASPTAAALETHYRAAAQRFFRPELYNRLDDVVVFRSLEASEIRAIAQRELSLVAARAGFRRRDVQLEVSPSARDVLAARGLDSRYGARPLKRTIERLVVAPVASWMASHPTAGATRLEIDAGGAEPGDLGELTLRATSLSGHEEGASRSEHVLERAALVRAEVRRWARSVPMRRVASDVSLFDRLSRQPAFWHDRAIADERARAAEEGRGLVAAFAAAERQAETAEDLAYDAYYGRQVAAAESLGVELDAVENQLVSLGERLYASMFPRCSAVHLVLTAHRSGWPHLVSLAAALDAWVKHRGGATEWFVPTASDGRPKLEGRDPARSKAHAKKEATPRWRWHKRAPRAADAPVPPAAAVHVTGGRALALLAAEHGAHRFTSGGATAVVKVRFEPRAGPLWTSEDPAEIEKAQPSREIRRIWPEKRTLYDARLERRFELGPDGGIDLTALLAAYQRWRVFRGEGEDEP